MKPGTIRHCVIWAPLVLSLALVPGAALASEEEVVLPLGSSAPNSKAESLELLPVVRSDGACRIGSSAERGIGDPIGCAFDDTTLGLTVASSLQGETSAVALKSAFARRSDAGFTLDRQFNDYMPGTSGETMLATAGLEVDLLDGQVKLASELGWSQSWRTPIANSTLQPIRVDQRSGTAQAHKLDIALVDEPKRKWSVEANYRNSAGEYRPVSMGLPMQLFGSSGAELGVATRGKLADWTVSGSWRSSRNDYFASERWKASVGYSGISLQIKRDRSETQNTASDLFVISPSSSARTQVSVDVIPMSILPQLALAQDGWGAFVPLTFSAGLGWRERQRYSSGELLSFAGSSLSLMGVWSSPIGDTLVTFDRESQKAGAGNFSTQSQADQTVLVDHSFSTGNWTLGGNMMLTRSRSDAAEGLATRDSNDMLFFGVSASYREKNGTEFAVSIGRDAMTFDNDGGSLRFTDRTTRLEAWIDLSKMLHSRLDRDDIHLRLEARVDLGGSGYEFRFLDEIIDSEFETLASQGVLLTFGMKLN